MPKDALILPVLEITITSSSNTAALPKTATILTILYGASLNKKVNAKSCNKSSDLIQKMKEVVGFLARETLVKACKISDPGSRLSSQLTIVLLNTLIVNVYLW